MTCGTKIKVSNNNYLRLAIFSDRSLKDKIKNLIYELRGENHLFRYKLYEFCTQQCAIRYLTKLVGKKVVVEITDNSSLTFKKATSPLIDIESAIEYIEKIYLEIEKQQVKLATNWKGELKVEEL